MTYIAGIGFFTVSDTSLAKVVVKWKFQIMYDRVVDKN